MEREKVIRELEECIEHIRTNEFEKIPCWGNCQIAMMDALGLLKEQEAEWVYGEDETGVDGWHCSECNFFEPWFYDFVDDDIDFIKHYEHCPKCGRRMTSYTGKQEGR